MIEKTIWSFSDDDIRETIYLDYDVHVNVSEEQLEGIRKLVERAILADTKITDAYYEHYDWAIWQVMGEVVLQAANKNETT